MNKNIEKKDNKEGILLSYQITSQRENGGSTEYQFMEDGAFHLEVVYGYMLPTGPVRLHVEDRLSDEEVLVLRSFIQTEMEPLDDYRFISMEGVESTLTAGDKRFIDCHTLTQKFMQVLNQIAAKHPIISRDSINPICRAMEVQGKDVLRRYNNGQDVQDGNSGTTYDSFHNCK